MGVNDFCMATLLDGKAGHDDGQADADGVSVTVGVTVTVTIIIADEGMSDGMAKDMAAADDDGEAIIIEADDDALFFPRPWRKASGISPPLYFTAMADPAKAATDRVNRFCMYMAREAKK